jgi:hypothetical protein
MRSREETGCEMKQYEIRHRSKNVNKHHSLISRRRVSQCVQEIKKNWRSQRKKRNKRSFDFSHSVLFGLTAFSWVNKVHGMCLYYWYTRNARGWTAFFEFDFFHPATRQGRQVRMATTWSNSRQYASEQYKNESTWVFLYVQVICFTCPFYWLVMPHTRTFNFPSCSV